MKKRQIIYISSISVLFAFALVFFFFYDIRDALNSNSLEVSVGQNIDIKKVKVIWENELGDKKIIFEKGEVTYLKFKEYGGNKFLVYYEGDFVGDFGHIKTNNWHGHSYLIQIEKIEDKIVLTSTIRGPDGDI